MNNYELTRRYWDWAIENPDLVKPTHTALFFYIIEKCVRLGWKEKFGLPTDFAKEAIGVKNYKTYIASLDFLAENGFIKMFQKSQNQHTANIVGLVNFTNANGKAHGKASGKASPNHTAKHVQSTASIDNDYNDNNDVIEEVETDSRFDDFFNQYMTESKHSDSNGKLRETALSAWNDLTDDEKTKAVSVGSMYAKTKMKASIDKDPKFIKRPHSFLSEKIFDTFDMPKPLDWIVNENGTYTFVDTDDRTKRYREDLCFMVKDDEGVKWYLKQQQ